VSRALFEGGEVILGRAAVSYSKVLLGEVRGVITMMPFSPLYREEGGL